MKLFWIIFFLSFTSHVKAQQPNKTLIEGNLAKITTNFMQIETNLNKRMSTYGMQLMYCETNLKASNLPKNFTDTLLTFMSAVRAVQYMQNHQISDLSKMNMSNFDYTQTRIMTLPTDIKLYSSIIGQLQTNGKMIQTYLRSITRHYMKNFRTLIKLRSKNKLMLAAIRESIGISNNFGAYIRLLKIRTTYLVKVNAYLNALITNKIVIPPGNVTLDPFMAKMKENEDKLAPKQAVTKNATLNALAKITAAQKTVQRSVGSSINITELMESMKNTFLEITATDDFPDLAWPRFPDIAGDPTIIKLRANLCEGKEQKLKDIEEKNKRRQERIMAAREKLNALTLSVSAKKVQASQTILDLIEATKGVETSYDGYKAGISQASTGMTQIREVFVPTTTTTSTTMRIPATLPTTSTKLTTTTLATTTTAPPCGTFMPYDVIKDPTAPARLGVWVGKFVDGSDVYVGYGSSVHCSASPAPSRISTKAPAGAYLTCTKEHLDNSTAFFLLHHPKLRMSLTNSVDMMKIPNTIKITETKTGLNYEFMFGWITIATGVNTIAKIHCSHNIFAAYFINATGYEKNAVSDFNVYHCLA